MKPVVSKTFIWILLAFFAIAAIFFFNQQQAVKKQDEKTDSSQKIRPIVVSVAEVKQADFPVWLPALGSVTPRQQVTIQSRISGQLLKLHFQEGQTVKLGQLLAEIDPEPIKAQLAQAKAQKLKDLAQRDNAKLDLQRYQQLKQEDAIAEQQVATQAALVKQIEATLASDDAQIDNLTLQLSYTKISAPITGVIGFKQIDIGNQIIANTTPIVSLIEQDPIMVNFALAEKYLPSLQQLQRTHTSTIEIWDQQNQHLLASTQIWLLDNQIDKATASISIKALFSNKDKLLYPNQFVQVRLLKETLKQATVIPFSALQQSTKGYRVYLVNEDKTHFREVDVTLLHQANDEVAVLGNLQAGELVITAGIDKLKTDSVIKVVATKDPTSKGNAKTDQPRSGQP